MHLRVARPGPPVLFPLGLVLSGLCLLLAPTASALSPADKVSDLIRTRIEAADHGAPDALVVAGETVDARQLVAEYYRSAAFEPVWTPAKGSRGLADSLVAALKNADREGLRPRDYHVPVIDSMLRRLHAKEHSGEPVDPGALADFDLLCTDAFLLYASHLLGGRVDPVDLHPAWNLATSEVSLTRHLAEAVNSWAIRSTLRTLRPPQPEYTALREALARYRRLQQQGGWPTLPDGPKLEQGTRDNRVLVLRRRLEATGDFQSDGPRPDRDSLYFGKAFHQAVSHFQERHGLTVDGIVGPATRAALNVPAAQRAEQIRVNLERWRWLPHDLGNSYVLVNVAGYWLRVVEDGRHVLQMRVIAGKQYRQTPVFSGEISYLVFNPYWHIPPGIAVKDKLPDFRNDPSLVTRGGYEILQGWGADARQVDPSTIDWNALSASNFPYRIRQRPGPNNALGQVKFIFPNPHNVYLHDTPSQHLFDRTDRDFSSGCVRIGAPLELAKFLLRDQGDWTTERIRAVTRENTERTVVLNEKVPVHLLYWTAWADPDGTVHFRTDVYNRDAAVGSALSRPLVPQRRARTPASSQ